MKYILMVILMFIMGCNQDYSGDSATENKFTITNTTGGEEGVFLYVNGVRRELIAGECVMVSVNDFEDLRIEAGRGGFLNNTFFDLCTLCSPNNYEIYNEEDVGFLYASDKYILRTTLSPNISKSCKSI
ncbi:MAG: hypothetical protein OXK80_00845 [Bdellovibrionales bacterium]|nr:hypothetical protein [Bdellovibrionales bacterium]